MNINYSKKIVIIGGGPCGLGAAKRLQDLGHTHFKLFEKNLQMGGLSRSFLDKNGFTWDIGGHVLFSHYPYFDRLMDVLLDKNEWINHKRESWIWLKKKFIPYPFQNNIKYLDKKDREYCIDSLSNLHKTTPKDFKEWILNTFGKGIADLFLIPYNIKIWAFPLEKLSFTWIRERVSVVDLNKIRENIAENRDDSSWGPNNFFRFPSQGGTGTIWRRLASRINQDACFLNYEVSKIDAKNKFVRFTNGHEEHYDVLISTIPLDTLTKISHLSGRLKPKLLHSSIHIIGIGVKGTPPKFLATKCWIYFPEAGCPFYRATIFSNYSSNNVPDSKAYWSIMVEISESIFKKVDVTALKDSVIHSLIDMGFIASPDTIAAYWYHFEPYGYPTPSINRDGALDMLTFLEKRDIYSRGRFGAWKYEVSNQDHSFMQGIEVVNRLLLHQPEKTVWFPQKINNH